MLTRILIIAFLTGTAQAFSFFCLKFLSATVSPENMSFIAQADSSLQLMLTIIALGLQSAAIRNIAQSENWKQEYRITQSARGTLSIFLFVFAISAFFQPANIIFLLAPLIAFSGDYALYAVGKPIAGAGVAFVRLVVPYSFVLVIAATSPESNIMFAFVTGSAVAYILTNLFISRHLQTRLFYKPGFPYLKLYLNSLPLGLVSLCLYFIGLGIVLIMPFFYPDSTRAVVFVGLKFYIIFKGVLRIIHQAFIKEMMNDDICLKVDQLSILFAIIYGSSFFIFPLSVIKFLFGERYLQYTGFFNIIGIAALMYSFFLSMATKSMLLKMDKQYTLVTAMAATVSLMLCIIFSFFNTSPLSVGAAIFIGELLWMLGLIKINYQKDRVIKRLVFSGEVILLTLIPFSARYLFQDREITYIISFVLLTALILHLKFTKKGLALIFFLKKWRN
ncbi:MAG: hypothetical protein K2X48_05805 [Chitinophagaceae bacterium]|nr:hypothetical protein [Chitinophagaceae bacterium]